VEVVALAAVGFIVTTKGKPGYRANDSQEEVIGAS